MKFLMLFWTEDVPEGNDHAEGFGTEADYQAWTDFESRLRESGAFVDSGDLQPARTAAFVRPTLAPDGTAEPSREGSVHVSGYYVVDVPDEAAARELASEVPLYGTVEVRAVVDYSAEY